MTISKDLMLSILSMDAYNRGYNPGLANLSEATDGSVRIGTAAVSYSLQSAGMEVTSEAADFYALAHTIGAGVDEIALGSTVISYRSTDHIQYEIAGR